MYLRLVSIFITLTLGLTFGQELLKNPDFEEPFTGDDWYAPCGELKQDSDSYTGSYSGKIRDRTQDWCQMSQNVDLLPNTRYSFSASIKLPALLEGTMWNAAQLLAEINYADATTDYLGHCNLPYLRPDLGWTKMSGDFKTQNKEISSARVYVQIREIGLEYKVDSASLTVVPDNPDWREEANERIEEIRMNDITINLQISDGYDPSAITVELSQTNHAFPFGTAIQGPQIESDDEYAKKYQECFYSNFNWAVQEYELKWNYMEKEREQIDFPDEPIRRLNERGIPTRGHCVLWGKEEHVPSWMYNTSPDYVRSEVARRIDYLVSRYSGQFVHWDVNNEMLNGPWYEENTNDPDCMADMFKEVRAKDPVGELFINEYGLVTYSSSAQAAVNTADRLVELGAEVGGIGAQSHWNTVPEIEAVAARLDVLESGGYPVWITELDIDEADVALRAEILDDLVTLYFSRAGVHGVILWHFSTNHGPCGPTCGLFEGDDFVPNAAGERWIEMTQSRWHTSAQFSCSSNDETFGVRGYYGDYQVQVFNNGNLVKNETFVLPTGSAVTVFIDI